MGNTEDASTPEPRRLTRREVVRYSAGGLALAGLGPVLAACGGDGDAEGERAETTTTKPPVSGGRLRLGLVGGGSADSIDAMQFPTASGARRAALYDAVAKRNHNFEIELQLAEELTPNATGSEWTVRLRDGVEFHNGKTLDADDLIFTIQRALDPDFPNSSASTWGVVDPEGIKKLDQRTVLLPMKNPVAVLDDLLATVHSYVVPVGYDPKNPVGSGPFKHKSFTPGTQSVAERFPNYWGDQAKVDALVIIDFGDSQSQVNALLSGEVDGINSLPPTLVEAVKSGGAQVVINPTGSTRLLSMRTDVSQFDDVRVRQAMKLIVNRDEVLAQALGSEGRLGNDLYSPDDPYYADDILQRTQDIEQAKSLLREAGREDLAVELVAAPTSGGVIETAQVFARQAKDAGVTVRIRQLEAGAFYGEDYLKYTFSVSPWGGPSFVSMSLLYALPDAAFPETHFSDAEFVERMRTGITELDPAKRQELFREAQEIFWDRSGTIIPAFVNLIDAYASNVGGVVEDKTGYQFSAFAFNELGFTS